MNNIEFLTPRICCLADIHLGSHQDNPQWHNIALEFAEWLKVKLISNNIKDIVICGDIFNNREEISVATIHIAKRFFTILKEFNIIALVGNHDAFYKDRTDVNSIGVFDGWENVTVVSTPILTTTFGKTIGFCPWGGDFNRLQKCDVLFGHFAIQTFKLNNYDINTSGPTSEELFKISNFIMTGHFHYREERKYDKETIIYVGDPYQINWADFDLVKGIYILNLNNLSYEFIENKISPSHKKFYLSKLITSGLTENIKKSFANNFIKVIIDTQIDDDKTEILYSKLCTLRPLTLKFEYLIENNIKNSNEEIQYDAEEFDFNKTVTEFVNKLDIPNKQSSIDYLIKLHKKVSEGENYE